MTKITKCILIVFFFFFFFSFANSEKASSFKTVHYHFHCNESLLSPPSPTTHTPRDIFSSAEFRLVAWRGGMVPREVWDLMR